MAVCVLGGVVIFGGLTCARISRRYRSEIVLNCGLFALALLVIATNVYAGAMHHVVLAYPFVLLAACRSFQLRRRAPVFKAAFALFLILNGSLLFCFPSMLGEARSRGDRRVYVAQLNRDLNNDDANNSVIACVDWGIYFVKALYGPRSEVVVSVFALEKKEQLQRIADIARRLHRNLTIVGYQNDRRTQLLRSMFSEVEERPERDDKNPWRIWRVPYEKLGNPGDSLSAAGGTSSGATTVP
jgi:hypothetical protein